MPLPKQLKRWYTVAEAATTIGSFFDESIAEQDVIDLVNGGDLPVWWDATGCYAVPLYPSCEFHAERKDFLLARTLGFEPSNEQLAYYYSSSDLLEPGDEYVHVLHGMYRLNTAPRSDYVEIVKDNDRAAVEFAHGLLAIDDDGETILKILRRYDSAPPFSTAVCDFTAERNIPPRTDIRFAATDIQALIESTRDETTATADRNPPEAIGDAERNKLLKQIAGLALLLAEKGGKYSRAGKPNANQIATAVEAIVDALPDVSAAGLKNSSIRESISSGLRLMTEG